MRILLACITVTFCFCVGYLHAQTENTPAPAVEEAQSFYAYGEVLSVSPEQILIREFDYATGEDQEVAYYINEQTSFDSVESVQQITPGNLVDIEFIVLEGGKNVAKDIFVDRVEEFEELESMED
ncbi:MAG: hypothetical protein PHV77_01900 [Candidatus Omnitrophica bacterium]|jgi:hypothetical protein|nr:hypothetical protein [Candidatus Omnitrophota bacterium]